MDEGRTIELLDTTLRDGAQSEGVSFSLQDKIAVVEVLDRLGVPLIEAGNPGSNPKDEELFRIVRDAPPKSSSIVAFGATRRPDATCDSDPQMSALADAGTSVVTLVGKAWGMHIREILRTTPDENERMIRESVAWLVAHGKRVIFDAEHFFFGWKDDRALAMRMAAAAAEAGASVVCLWRGLPGGGGGGHARDDRPPLRTLRRRHPRT